MSKIYQFNSSTVITKEVLAQLPFSKYEVKFLLSVFNGDSLDAYKVGDKLMGKLLITPMKNACSECVRRLFIYGELGFSKIISDNYICTRRHVDKLSAKYNGKRLSASTLMYETYTEFYTNKILMASSREGKYSEERTIYKYDSLGRVEEEHTYFKKDFKRGNITRYYYKEGSFDFDKEMNMVKNGVEVEGLYKGTTKFKSNLGEDFDPRCKYDHYYNLTCTIEIFSVVPIYTKTLIYDNDGEILSKTTELRGEREVFVRNSLGLLESSGSGCFNQNQNGLELEGILIKRN